MLDQILWLVPLGFAAGLLGSMVGLGGGIIIVPVLTFLGFPPTLAASNSLFAALSNAVGSTISYSRQRRIDYSLGVRLGLLSVPGTIAGAAISTDAAPDVFKALFGLVLVASAAYIFLRKRMGASEGRAPRYAAALAVGASFAAGMISSFFGVGGGVVFVPLMVVGMGLAMRRAAPTSQMVLLFASLSGVISHSVLGHPDFAQAGLLAAGAFAGGLAGARLSAGIREGYLRILASVALLAVAAKLFYDSACGSIPCA